VLDNAANEVVFGVVGHVGSGTSEMATTLKGLLTRPPAVAAAPADSAAG
jgi:hypothetical protein